MGLFYLLQGSEYLDTRGQNSRFIISVGDVTARDKAGHVATTVEQTVEIEIRIRGSKTDQEGRGVSRTLQRSGSAWFCPVLAVWSILRHAATINSAADDPLCTYAPGRVVNGDALSRKLKQAAQRCGIDPARVATHSLRSGGATAMYDAKVETLELKQFGRWRSNAVERYVRMSATTTKGLARRMTESVTKGATTTYGHTEPAAYRIGGAPPRPTRAWGAASV